jgi:hypothetical protein
MISITIEYRPWGLLRSRNKEAQLPERWSEMTPAQLSLIPSVRRGVINENRMLRVFLNLKSSLIKRLDAWQRHCILQQLDYINKPEAHSSFMIRKVLWFKAPAARLKDITFGQFIFGDSYYQSYIEGNLGDLDRFIACFYTDKKGFSDKTVESNSKIIRAADLHLREAIAINYALIREWLAKEYPYLFRRSDKPGKSSGWVTVFDLVVGDDIANHDKYAASPLSMVLRYLNNKIKESYKHGSNV